jgi:hypothetical protein
VHGERDTAAGRIRVRGADTGSRSGGGCACPDSVDSLTTLPESPVPSRMLPG